MIEWRLTPLLAAMALGALAAWGASAEHQSGFPAASCVDVVRKEEISPSEFAFMNRCPWKVHVLWCYVHYHQAEDACGSESNEEYYQWQAWMEPGEDNSTYDFRKQQGTTGLEYAACRSGDGYRGVSRKKREGNGNFSCH